MNEVVEAVHTYEPEGPAYPGPLYGRFMGWGEDQDAALLTTFVHWIALLRKAGIRVPT